MAYDGAYVPDRYSHLPPIPDTPRDEKIIGNALHTGHHIGENALFNADDGKGHVALLAYELTQKQDPKARWSAAKEMAGLGLEIGALGAEAYASALEDTDADGALRIGSSIALSQLGPVSGDIGARALANTLLDEDNELFLRSSVAASLGKLTFDAMPVGILALTRALDIDKDPVVRRQAALSLGEIGHDTGVRCAERASVPALAKALSDGEVSVRWRAAEAIGFLGALANDGGAAALDKALREDPDTGLRRRAALSFGQLGETAGAHTAAVYNAFHNDTHDVVKAQAKISMEQIRDASVSALSSSEHEYVRGRAAWAIGELREFAGEDAVEVLLAALALEPEIYVRRRVLEAIGKIGTVVGDAGASALALARKDADPYISAQAIIFYDELGIEVSDAGIAALDKLRVAAKRRLGIEEDDGKVLDCHLAAQAEFSIQAEQDVRSHLCTHPLDQRCSRCCGVKMVTPSMLPADYLRNRAALMMLRGAMHADDNPPPKDEHDESVGMEVLAHELHHFGSHRYDGTNPE